MYIDGHFFYSIHHCIITCLVLHGKLNPNHVCHSQKFPRAEIQEAESCLNIMVLAETKSANSFHIIILSLPLQKSKISCCALNIFWKREKVKAEGITIKLILESDIVF